MNKLEALRERQFEIIIEEESKRDMIRKLQSEIDSLVAESIKICKEIELIDHGDDFITFEESVRFENMIKSSKIRFDNVYWLDENTGGVKIIDYTGCLHVDEYPTITKKQLKEVIKEWKDGHID